MITAAGTGTLPSAKPRAASRPDVSILAAMADDNLLGRYFASDTFDAWKTFHKALAGEPMTPQQLETYRKHTGRQTPPTSPAREACVVVGRRAGKSLNLAALAVWKAVSVDWKPHLAAGEFAVVAILAADRNQAKVIKRYVSGMLNETPLFKSMIAEEREEAITLKNSVSIEIMTANYRSVRGRSVSVAILDEVAFWRDESSANPAAEIARAIRPSLANLPGSLLLMASSPYSRSGLLWNQHRAHHGVEGSPVLSWQAASRDMNPSLDAELVKAAIADDPKNGRAEWLGEFRTDISEFIDRQVIESVTMPGRHELPPMSGYQYRAFVDPSGGSNDSYCLAIAHPERIGTGPDAITTTVLDVVRKYKPPFSPEAVTAEIADLVAKYRCHTVTGDRYAGEFPRELFSKRQIEYRLSDRPASDIFRDSLPLFNSGRVELLDNNRLAN